jgi:hypothetical protein
LTVPSRHGLLLATPNPASRAGRAYLGLPLPENRVENNMSLVILLTKPDIASLLDAGAKDAIFMPKTKFVVTQPLSNLFW